MYINKNELISRMDRIIHWVEVCDTKTSIILAVQAMVLTVTCSTDFVFVTLKEIIKTTFFYDGCKEFSFLNLLVIVLFMSLIIMCSVSMFHLFKVLEAKTNANQTGQEHVRDKDSLIHFQCIANQAAFPKFDSFADAMNSETEDGERKDLLSQIYINAVRCNEKFKEYNNGLKWLKRALIVLIIFVVTVFVREASV